MIDSHDDKFNTPVLFMVFNRPEHTRKVLEQIRKVEPTNLYVAADGPRKTHPEEHKLCDEVRRIINDIDWKCNVYTLFREHNLGCRYAISSAIDWFFKNNKEGIILEDDCLPDSSFFPYCRELLEKYRHNDSVAMISGSSLYDGDDIEESYYFTKYPSIWGWASWRRTWEKYDNEVLKKDNDILSTIKKNSYSKRVQKLWEYNFIATRDGYIDTWDYQFLYTCWKHDLRSIAPCKNMISNIGFGVDATNTIFSSTGSKNPAAAIQFPLIHPKYSNTFEKDKVIELKYYYRSAIFLLLLKHYGFLKKTGILSFTKKIMKLIHK